MSSYAVGAGLLTLGTATGPADLTDLTRAGLGAAAAVLGFGLLALAQPRGLGLGGVKIAGLLGLHTAWLSWTAWYVGLLAGVLAAGLWALTLLLAGPRASTSRSDPSYSSALSRPSWSSTPGQWPWELHGDELLLGGARIFARSRRRDRQRTGADMAPAHCQSPGLSGSTLAAPRPGGSTGVPGLSACGAAGFDRAARRSQAARATCRPTRTSTQGPRRRPRCDLLD